MIRGAQKKMIVIRTHDSRVFEEAYFVMRRDTDIPAGDSDMLSEADRIIRRSMGEPHADLALSPPTRPRFRPWLSHLGWLLAGLLLGSGGAALFFWLG